MKEIQKRIADYYDKIQRGSIVSVQNPKLIVKQKNYKLRPCFRNRFLVIKREESAVYLVPCDEIYHTQFFDEKIPKYQKEPNCYYKADISKVKLLNGEFPANSHYFMKFSLFFEILTKFSEISS